MKQIGYANTSWGQSATGVLRVKYNECIPEGSRFGLHGFDWLKERWMKEQFLDKVKALNNLAQQLGISMPQLSIAWCIKNPNVSTAILGATNKEQLVENLKAEAAAEKLTAEVMQQIDDIVQTKPVLPEH